MFDKRFTEDAEGDEYVLPTYRKKRLSYAGNKLRLSVADSGVDSWPRLFHSMRSTRQTELVERFPVHVVCAWLGNTIDIAETHYLKTTEQHFKADAEVAQKAAQSVTEQDGRSLNSSDKKKMVS